MEVIYTGLRQTSEMIAEAALREDVDVVGLSILSGAHMALTPRLLELLKNNGQSNVKVFVGGMELMQASKPVSKSNVAMLAALNIADELHRLKDSHEAILNRLDQLSKRISTTLTEEG